MKILHLSDLHIGKKVKEFNLIEDQRYVLEQAVQVIEEKKPDVVVIAGDLYDRSVPPVEAVSCVNEFFSKVILELKTPVIAIAGNHDSGIRLDFANSLLEKQGLYIEGSLRKEVKKVTLKDSSGNVNFYMIPYADPAEVRELYSDESIKTHDDAMKLIISKINEEFNSDERNVAIAHGFITYMKDGEDECHLEVSDSERPLSIGGTDIVSAKYFEEFNYTALGHLHGAQKVGSDKMRYGGSLIKYSFSEVTQKKVFTLVDLDDKGEVSIELIPVQLLHDMRIIKGPLEELIKKEVYDSDDVDADDYIKIILQDKDELIDPLSRLRAVYPNIMELEREVRLNLNDNKTAASKGFKEKSEVELFKEFYKSMCEEDMTQEQCNILEEAVKEALKDEVV